VSWCVVRGSWYVVREVSFFTTHHVLRTTYCT